MHEKFFDTLSDGRTFDFWDCTTDFKKTYYVSKASNASDDNPGTKDAPFATIDKAAKVLMPGEKVLIGGGVYDELVRPARGGEGPDKMISYEAVPGEKVVLTGARQYKNGWNEPYGWRTHGFSAHYNLSDDFNPNAKIYEGNFERDDFEKVNPFSMVNCASQAFGGCEFWFHYLPQESDWRPFLKRRGLLFCDGEALTQVNYLCHLSQVPGSYWVEDSGYKIFIRLKDDSHPDKHVITYTARDQLFLPEVPYTSYVRVKGLEFEFVGNGVPGSQKGALSTFCGHHWIIEDNKVRWANGVGIDFGHVTTERYSDEISGGSIVRRNHVSNCGVCGIAALPGSPDRNKSILVEHNILDDNAWHDIEFNYENGGIKVHGIVDSLLRFNIVRRTGYGSAIWADFGNKNSRICANVVIGGDSSIMGGIFIEASDVPNVIDHNLVYDYNRNPLGTIPQRTSGGGHGIYQHDCDFVHITRNILLGLEGTGVFLNWGDPIRICNGHGPIGVGFEVNENIIADCDRAYVMPTEKNKADSNVFGMDFRGKAPIMIERNHEIYEMLDMRAARMFHDWEKNGKMCEIGYDIEPEKLTLRLVFTVENDSFEQNYDLTKPFDLQPIFDYLKTRDTSMYEAVRFGTRRPQGLKKK